MSTAATSIMNASYEERLYCPRCDVERPFTVTIQGYEEFAECARCGYTEDRQRFIDDFDDDPYEGVPDVSTDGGGWD